MNQPQERSGARFVDIIPLQEHELPRILVADNDPLTADQLMAMANVENFSVVSVKDGREAYRILKAHGDFSAVILDMTLPHIHSVDIIRYMKTEKRLARIPVIIVSGDHGFRMIADSFAAGAMAFLPKPFNGSQLRRMLRIALSGVSRQSLEPAA